MPPKLTSDILKAAIAGFEQQKVQIDAQISELRAMLPGGNTHATTPESAAPKRKRFSAAVRRKMAMAQRARWAKIKGDSEAPAPLQPAKPERRRMSATARAKIAEAQRKRWAASKKAAAPKPKRKLSAAGRAAIIAATKKRWRLQKATAKTKSAGAKKAAGKKVAAKKTVPAQVTTQAAD